MAIVENIQRENLNPVEVALGYHRLIDECGLTQEEVAKKVSKNRSTVANTLRLLRLPPPVLASLRDGTLTSRPRPDARLRRGRRRAAPPLPRDRRRRSSRCAQVEQLIREYRKRLDDDDTPTEDAVEEASEAVTTPSRDALQLKQFTGALRDRLSTQVKIRHKDSGSGKIEIDYYSQDDLERVLELLLER